MRPSPWMIAALITAVVSIINPIDATADPAPLTFAAQRDCQLTALRPNPIITLPGGGGPAVAVDEQDIADDGFVQTMLSAGACVFGMFYGVVDGLGVGAAPIAASAGQLADYIETVKGETGAMQVDIVAHSQGALVANYYTKVLGGAANVGNIVSFAPVTHGSRADSPLALINENLPEFRLPNPGGLAQLLSGGPVLSAVADLTRAPGWLACLEGSDAIQRVSEGGITVPGVRYFVMATRNDTVNTPAGDASFIDETGVSNAYFEDLFPAAGPTTHRRLLAQPQAWQWTIAMLYGPRPA
ncbi:esterase/lipase family protein [Nocardia suismassiliense]|uniref:Esterase/lipase family protein n=1 Tax=Nocardia suismassiliense TaxID=2077092 RepID=A0ABW6R4H1_9NOCA